MKHLLTFSICLLLMLCSVVSYANLGDDDTFIFLGTHNNSTYYCSNSSDYTWHEAKAAAEAYGGHLAIVDNAAENEFIRSSILADYVWLGLTDENDEGNYYDVFGNPCLFMNWNSGEPNNGGGHEHYVRLLRNNGKWTDRNEWFEAEFVIEIPTNPNPPTPTGDVCTTRTASHVTHCNSGTSYGGYIKLDDENDFYHISNAQLVEYTDGSATFTGTWTNHDDDHIVFDFEIYASGRTSTASGDSPKEHACLNPNYNDFYYYSDFTGTLYGREDVEGAKIAISTFGESLQLGVGAHHTGNQNSFGGSAWYSGYILQQPNNGDHIELDPSSNGHLGDINVMLTGAANDVNNCSPTNPPNNSQCTSLNEIVAWNLDACQAYSGAYSYDEFQPSYTTPSSCGSISATKIYRNDSGTYYHSCLEGMSGNAMCLSGTYVDYLPANSVHTVRFSASVPAGQTISGLSFYQKSEPEIFNLNEDGTVSTNGTSNNYLKKFALRVKKNGTTIFESSNNSTSQSNWELENFTFGSSEFFATQSTTYDFELVSYDPIENGASVRAWELDEIKLFGCCGPDLDLMVDAGLDQEICLSANEVATLTASVSDQSTCINQENACGSIDATNIYRNDASSYYHSCLQGVSGRAMCLSGTHVDYLPENSVHTVRFSTTVPAGQTVSGLSFYQKSEPHIINLNEDGSVGTNPTSNNYLKKFALRVKKNGTTIFESSNNSTSQSNWELENFAFASTEFFAAQSTTYDFELVSYDPIGNGSSVRAWELDEIKLFGCCGSGQCTSLNEIVSWDLDECQAYSDAYSYDEFEAEYTIATNNDVTYLWSNGETTPSIDVSSIGEYCVTVTDCDGDTAEDCVNVNAFPINGGTIAFDDGGTEATVCLDLNQAPLEVTIADAVGTNQAWVITDSDLNILALPTAPPFDLSGAGEGTCLIWSLSYETIAGAEVGLNAADLTGCFDLSNPLTANREVCIDPANIGDKVFFDTNNDGFQDATELGADGVSVRLISAGPDGDFHTGDDVIEDDAVTANGGLYLFADVAPGTYCIEFVPATIPAGFVFSPKNASGNNETDSDADAVGKTDPFTIMNGQDDDLSFDAGIYETPVPNISAGDITVNEEDGTAVIEICLDEVSTNPVSVDYTTNDGSALVNDDYLAQTGTVTIPAGELCALVTIDIVDDEDPENTEELTIVLSNPTNGEIADPEGVITILDTDIVVPNITINDIEVNEEDGTAVLDICLDQTTTIPVFVDYVTNNGSALAGDDYLLQAGTVTIAPGDLCAMVTIDIVDDEEAEDTEEFTVTLPNSTNGEIADDEGTVTILDTDVTPDPVATINDVEVNEEDGTATLEVCLDAVSTEDVTIDFSTEDDSADGTDYTGSTGTVTIPAGDLCAEITIDILDDEAPEDTEEFVVNLSNPTNAVIGDPQGTVTILDTDVTPDPVATINDVEVNEEDGTATLEVCLDAASTEEVTIDYSTADGSADGTDYTGSTGTVTIPAGDLCAEITIDILDDEAPEDTEEFVVNLSNPTNAVIGDPQGTVTILDTDVTPDPVVTINDVEVNEEDGTATLEVCLDVASTEEVTIDYSTADGSADGTDYTGSTGTVTIPAGDLCAEITIDILDDEAPEDTEEFVVNLSNPTNAVIGDPQGTVTILDTDVAPLPEITIEDVEVNEEDGTIGVPVCLDFVSDVDVTVEYLTVSGTALAAQDFDFVIGELTIPAGDLCANILVPIIDDATPEDTEVLTIGLVTPTNAIIADDEGTVTILDTDVTPDPVATINDVEVNEEDGTATLEVCLDAASTEEVTIDYSTADGSADGTDYTGSTGTVTIPAGDLCAEITIDILDDEAPEDTEEFVVNLSNPTNAVIGDPQGTVTILDTDVTPDPVVTINDVEVNEEDGTATLEVCLDVASTEDVTIDFSTEDDSANGTDYSASTGTITIPAGDLCAEITIEILDDAAPEDTEEFNVNLSNPTNAVIGDPQGIVTILDTDVTPDPIATISDVTVNEEDGTATLEVCLDATSTEDVTIDFSTEDDSANGTDYSASTGTITIPAGDLCAEITIEILDDAAPEDTEEFVVNLSNPTNAVIGDPQGTVTILDTDVTPDPVATINDVEVNEEDGTATLEVCLDAVSTEEVTIEFSTADGSADATDYTGLTGTVTIPAGDLCAEITIDILDDEAPEDTEEFVVNLSNPTNAVIGDPQGTVTILDTDVAPLPEITIEDVEVNEEDGTIGVPVCLDFVSDVDVTVEYLTVSGTALAAQDFDFVIGELTIPAGDLCANILVPIIDDATPEDTEVLTIGLVTPTNAIIADDEGTVTILDTDVTPDPVATITDLTVNEEDGTATLEVCLDAASTEDVTIDFSTADVSADATDYIALTGMITIPAGDLCADITIEILDDLLNEDTEEFVVNLTNASNAVIGDPQGKITILDNDLAPDLKLSIDDVTVNEEDGTATLKVCLDLVSGTNVTVDYSTSDDSALEAVDYVADAGTLMIPAGDLCVDVVINIVDDATPEDTEVLKVVLSNESGAVVADGIGTITILDTDVVAPLPSLDIKNVTVNEEDGIALIDVCLEAVSDEAVTVEYATADLSAVDGSDYSAVSGTLTIPAGEQCVSVEVPVLDDEIEEDTEILYVNLTNATNATIADPQGTVTILDTDAPVTGGCDAIVIAENNGVISTSGYSDPIVFVKIYDNNWNLLFDSGMLLANEPQSYTLPSAGDYWVFVKTYGTNWAPICDEYKVIKVEDEPDPCAALGGDSDGDGVCDDDDICPGFDDNVDLDGDGIPDGCDDNTTAPCVTRTVSNMETCPGVNAGASLGGYLRIAGQNFFYDFEDGEMLEYLDGTATLTGTWVNQANADLQFDVVFELTGKTGTAFGSSPKLNDCTTPDYSKFYYYSDFTGTLTGQGLAEGAVIEVEDIGGAFQVGEGATNVGSSDVLGASAWLQGSVVSQPTTGLVINLSATGTGNIGDIGIELSGSSDDCRPCVDADNDGNCDEAKEICTERDATDMLPCPGVNGGLPLGGYLALSGLDDIYTMYNGELIEYTDGTAILAGRWFNQTDPSLKFDVIFELSGKTAEAIGPSPKLSDCTTPDYSQYYYYTELKGKLIGDGSQLDGAIIEVEGTGGSFQIGEGATNVGSSEALGASAWLTGTVLQQPDNGLQLILTPTGTGNIGDIGVELSGDIEECRPCEDVNNDGICDDEKTICTEREVTNVTQCNGGADYGGYLKLLGLDYQYSFYNGELIEYSDGTALLSGRWFNVTNPAIKFDVTFKLSGKTAIASGDSPKENYCGSGDYNGFYYYSELTGKLAGDGSQTAGAIIEVTGTGAAFQIGVGGSVTGASNELGGSAWFTGTVITQPMNGLALEFDNSGNGQAGDINILLSGDVADCPADAIDPTPTNSPCGTTITTGPSSISISGYSEPIAIIQVFDSNWAPAYSCMGDCANPLTIDGLAEGTYYVKVKLYTANWQEACTELAGYYTVSGTNLIGQDGDILYFNAVKDGREVAVNWTVNTAYKTDMFVTERSDDGINFTPVMDLKNDRDTEEVTNFNDKDETPMMGRNFYRLKQVFVDGTYRYSNIKTIDFDLDVLDFTVYPNPTTDMIYINLSEFSGLSGTIQLTNGLGITLQEVNLEAIPTEAVGLEVAKYPAGMYNINVKLDDRKHLTKRFVKGRK